MQNLQLGIIIIVAVAALALIIFLVMRNKKDRKEIYSPEKMDDAVGEQKMEQQRREDRR
ncbi:MAG: hypothetical protein P0Y53_16205 [Candidatus Pseudobacter hemicellulosilyticus]|uniref:Uncharacterized protein n=1 Tax=Candidatus Pseudobacter hemicellulosilyticus TaxID=3121375 RepID=A0AAJ5WLC5_9BACT|nr:MAG: hypothetical protein P0Y53_16205 [Pseudobacter sp.]